MKFLTFSLFANLKIVSSLTNSPHKIPKKIVYFGNNTPLNDKIESYLLRKDTSSQVIQNDDFNADILNNDIYAVVVDKNENDMNMKALIDQMKKNKIQKLVSFSKEKRFDFSQRVDLKSLCGSDIVWSEIYVNEFADKKATEGIQVNMGTSVDFLKSEISFEDAAIFCANVLFDKKNPYSNQKIYIQESQKSLEELTEEIEHDPMYKISKWIGLFPAEKKWKNLRFMIYAFAGGFILSDTVHKVTHSLFHTEIKDFWM